MAEANLYVEEIMRTWKGLRPGLIQYHLRYIIEICAQECATTFCTGGTDAHTYEYTGAVIHTYAQIGLGFPMQTRD